MFKVLLLVSAFILGSQVAKAYNESPGRDSELKQEIKYDNIFETSENAQLQVDREYAVNDVGQSEIELNAEKSKVENLKNQNAQLTDEVKKNNLLAKQNRKLAKKESVRAASLERLVKIKAKQLEKLKIANINMKKSIEMSLKKQAQAEMRLKQIEAHRKHQTELKKGLSLKKKDVVKSKNKFKAKIARR